MSDFAQDMAEEARENRGSEVCHWKSANRDLNSWTAGCNGNYFYLNNDTRVVAGFTNCPYCGKEIDVEINPEPVYEWQWVVRYQTGTYSLTTEFYRTKNEAQSAHDKVLGIEREITECFEKSRRPYESK